MNLSSLRAQARAVATRIDTRINAALTGNRELSADEEAANTADAAELAGIDDQIDAAIAGLASGGEALAGVTSIMVSASAEQAAALQALIATAGTEGVIVAVASGTDADAERARIMGLVDLCPESALSEPLRTAIEGGVEAGAFAIDLAKAAKTRGATVEDLARGAVQPGQLPTGAGRADTKPPVGAARGASIVARAAALGHSAVKHLKQG